jgi:PAS domain-containing protein
MANQTNFRKYTATPFFASAKKSLLFVEAMVLVYVAYQSHLNPKYIVISLVISGLNLGLLPLSIYANKNLFLIGLPISFTLVMVANFISPIEISFAGYTVSLVFYAIFLVEKKWVQLLYSFIFIIGVTIGEVTKGTELSIILMILIPAMGFTSLFYNSLIHLQKTQEELIKKNQELNQTMWGYDSLIENTSSNIWCIDNSYSYIRGNSHFEKQLLKSSNKKLASGDPILSYLSNEEEFLFFKNLYDRGLNGESFTIETEGNLESNPCMEYTVNPMKDSAKKIYGVTIISKDISKKKKYEKERIELQKLLDATIHKMPIGFELFDKNGNLRKINQMQLQNLHLEDTSINLNQFNVFHNQHIKHCVQPEFFKMALDTNEIINYEKTIEFKEDPVLSISSSKTSYFEVSLFSISDEKDQTKGVVALTNNITLKRKHEQKLIEQTKRFEEYSFTLSHIIRRPVANLISLSSLLHTAAGLDAEDQQTIDHLHESVRQLDEIIKTINKNLTHTNN